MTPPALPEKTVPLLLQAAEFGLKLEVKDSKTLTVEPAERCPQEFADELRRYKWHLLCVLSLPFVIVRSATLGETVFFCADEPTKAALVAAGAEEWSIYSKDELRTLGEQNRVAPLSQAELRKVHEIKRAFDGRITK
jgi:hypothetical protein